MSSISWSKTNCIFLIQLETSLDFICHKSAEYRDGETNDAWFAGCYVNKNLEVWNVFGIAFRSNYNLFFLSVSLTALYI